MLKIIGVIMILCSGTAIGFKASDNLLMQNKELKKLKKLLIILRGEINFNCSTLSEALRNVSDKTTFPYESFMKRVSEKMNEYSGNSLNRIWNESIDIELKKSHLNEKQLAKLKELGESLGYLDKEMQINTFNIYLEQLDDEIKENDRTLKDNSKLYRCLGFMGSILVTLIIT